MQNIFIVFFQENYSHHISLHKSNHEKMLVIVGCLHNTLRNFPTFFYSNPLKVFHFYLPPPNATL